MTTSVPVIPRRETLPAQSQPSAQFLRPDRSGFLAGWPSPVLREAKQDVRQAWAAVASRSIESIHNSGWMKGAVDQAVGDTIGSGLKLNPKPDWKACGFSSQEEASEWARDTATRFRAYARNPLECDARGKMTIAKMAKTRLRTDFAFGEGLARVIQRRRWNSATTTKIQLLSPLRITQETREEARLHQGVFLDEDGMAVAYRVRVRQSGVDKTVTMPARDKDGRPLIIHTFDGDADQTRGISPFAAILKVFRQVDQLADATLVAALLQTIFAATVKSDALSEEIFEGLMEKDEEGNITSDIGAFINAKADWAKGAKLDLGAHGKIAHLFFGEELQFHNTNHPHNNYLPFMRNLLREIARAVGVSYEALAFDYEGATYSSVRMGIASLWPQVVSRREDLVAPFYQAVYDAWIEEQIFKGWIKFPGGYRSFLRMRGAATQAEWNGPAKPTADDLKSAKSMGERLERGVSNLSYECGELGYDWEEVVEQRARESKRFQDLGLSDPHASKGSPFANDKDDGDADEKDDSDEVDQDANNDEDKV
ncbi:MAG: phage portal protein [Roseibium sp.]|uniref:phage portal protein n=1 Tax=Roseibium sp. TaxID=1936156 RepID=UPI00261684E5|nr:phage portal protein [Roseibium sp.]MCV0427817.1 phage portal protein [Roseibium sp.]